MAISASLGVYLTDNGIKRKSAIEIIQVLIDSGWILIHNEYISYISLGSSDRSNWQTTKNMSIEELMQILQKKEGKKEIIGVRMTWQNTDIGGDFLFWPKKILLLQEMIKPL